MGYTQWSDALHMLKKHHSSENLVKQANTFGDFEDTAYMRWVCS
jgi:hypothetical protein